MINETPASLASDPIIKVEGVSKKYHRKLNNVNALEDVTISIGQGEFIAITGESGSGKSTLLQILGGLEQPSTGRVEVLGVDISKLGDKKRAVFRQSNIGFVFQFFYLQPFLTLRQNIELPRLFVSKSKQYTQDDHLDALVARLGIDERLDHLPGELSGGQIQRAAIARALINNPKVLLADEPTGNLDQVSADKIVRLFQDMRRDFNTTVVIVTHDKNIAALADRVITLNRGSLV